MKKSYLIKVQGNLLEKSITDFKKYSGIIGYPYAKHKTKQKA